MQSDYIKRELHSHLAYLIYKRGKHFRKPHGAWVYLKIGEDYFFQLDSWNNAITWCKGEPVYNECTGFADKHNGFRGKVLKYLGIDFGRFEGKISEEEYKGFIFIIENQKP